MALRSGFPSRVRPRSPRRKTKWSFGVEDDGSVDLAASGKQGWSSGIVLVLESSVTLVRIRGEVLSRLRSATTALDGFRVAYGIGLATNEAFSVGNTALPGPITDADWDGWIWHTFGFIFSDPGDAEIVDGQSTIGFLREPEATGWNDSARSRRQGGTVVAVRSP